MSNWRLARAVSELGQLGVVSGTALDQVFARRLQDGDPGGHMRRALDRFPFRAMAERVWRKYFVRGGKPPGEPYKPLPMLAAQGPRESLELCIVSNFAEVFLAREGHSNPVGINYMEKLQLWHLASVYGAMLAGVSYVLMGAGIPMRIPGALDRLAAHEQAAYPLHAAGGDAALAFTPSEFMECALPSLTRPEFLAIISSSALATTLARKANGKVDGFIIEGPTAGGHNAPPRGQLTLNEAGEPVYGERDSVDLTKIRALGLPFWLAGGCGSAEGLRAALAAGAAGVQVGTAFAFCAESGMRDDYKAAVLEQLARGEARVFTDPLASPAGFPFKIAGLEGTLSEESVFRARRRACDLGYLREAYRTPQGQIGFRCPAEPVAAYTAKGGGAAVAAHRKCICNGLMSTAGYPQVQANGYVEPGVITAGDDLNGIVRFLAPGAASYRAADVIFHVLKATNA
ncbi:MAG: nitronate monooxygenase [Acidobacteriota bacterium]